MQLTITKEAEAKLKPYFDDKNAVILLDFDDGVGPFSKVGVCSLNQAFQLVVAPKEADLHDYDQVLETNLGKVYYKGYSDMYLDQVMQLKDNGMPFRDAYKKVGLPGIEPGTQGFSVLCSTN